MATRRTTTTTTTIVVISHSVLSRVDGTASALSCTLAGYSLLSVLYVHYTAVPSGAALPQIPVSLSTETAAFAQISETGDAQYPYGDASLRYVDLSKVCLSYRSCQAYGYASFIGFMVYMRSLRAFPSSGFSELVFPTAGLLQRFQRGYEFWVWLVGV